MSLCANGHQVPDGSAFCPECGTRMDPSVSHSSDSSNSDVDRSAEEASRDDVRRRNVVIIAGAIAAFLLLAGIIVILTSSSGSTSDTSSSSSSSESASSIDQCATNLVNWVVSAANSEGSGSMPGYVTQFGMQSGIGSWIGNEVGPEMSSMYQQGQQAAQAAEYQRALSECNQLKSQGTDISNIPGP